MNEIPFDFVRYAVEKRAHIKAMIENNVVMCLSQPYITFRKIYDSVGDILKKFKKSIQNNQNIHQKTFVRNLAYGISAGSGELNLYQ